ncbi:hypothetical protein JXQ70_13215 [bacterium]|nr:hypothetical protein [bacterium]
MVIFLCLVLTGNPSFGPPGVEAAIKPEYGGKCTIALARTEIDLDPLKCDNWEEHWIQDQMFECLFTMDHGQVYPELASQASSSANNTIWHIQLLPDVLFTSQKQLTAYDVSYSLQRAALFQSQSRLGFPGPLHDLKGYHDYVHDDAESISGIVVHSATELALHFIQAQPFLREELSRIEYAIIAEGSFCETHPIGTGPFGLSPTMGKKTGLIELEAHASYRRGRPYLERLVFLLGTPPSTAAHLFEQGQIDLFFQLYGQWPTLQAFLNTELYEVQILKPPALVFLDLNSRNPCLQDHSIKQALCDALERDAMLTILLSGQGAIARAIIDSNFSPYFPLFEVDTPDDQPPEKNIAENTLKKCDQPLQLIVPERFPILENIADRIQVNLLKSDILVRIEKLPLSQFEKQLANMTYDSALHYSIFDQTEPAFILEQFVLSLSGPSSDRSGVLKPFYDRLLYYKKNKTTESKELNPLYPIEHDLVQSKFFFPLFHPHFAAVTTKRMKGMNWTVTSIPRFENVWFMPDMFDESNALENR